MRLRIALVLVFVLLASPIWAGTNIVIVLDDSGSMTEAMHNTANLRRIDAAKAALLKMLDQVPNDAHIGLLALNTGGQNNWVIPLGPVDRASVATAVSSIEAEGGTPLGAALKIGADALLAHRDQQRYGTYKLLIVTDGEATDPDLLETYLPEVLARGVTVDVIGVDMASAHSLATKVQTYRRADDPASLSKAVEELVLGESSGQDVNAGESDYELLAGLPDEVCAAAVTALTKPRNEPIGSGGYASAVAASGGPASGGPTSVNSPAVPKNEGSGNSSIKIFVVLIAFLVIANFVFRAAQGSKQRRRH